MKADKNFQYILISLPKGAKANNPQTGKKGRAAENGKRNPIASYNLSPNYLIAKMSEGQ